MSAQSYPHDQAHIYTHTHQACTHICIYTQKERKTYGQSDHRVLHAVFTSTLIFVFLYVHDITHRLQVYMPASVFKFRETHGGRERRYNTKTINSRYGLTIVLENIVAFFLINIIKVPSFVPGIPK